MSQVKINQIEINNRAAQFIEDKQYVEAIRLLENNIGLTSSNTALLYNLAIAYEGVGDYSQAMDFLKKALDSEKEKKAEILGEMAYCLFKQENYDEAMDMCESALSVDAACSRVWNLKGVLLFLGKSYEQAYECFEKSVEIDSSCADAWFNLADTCELLGKKEREKQARAMYDKLIKGE
ncbi:tetratricopeptide repeat protein [Spirochaetia bacterium 38H-sp]|uniref:Tetratricopeptide repeat protein n=1 Tax=Rarispira pelagica TaxID=3141764 RepID=A0ABU9U9E4_9SPIR